MEPTISFKACAPPHCQCPEMDIYEDGEFLIIKDDHKGEVLIKFHEMDLIAEQWFSFRGRELEC